MTFTLYTTPEGERVPSEPSVFWQPRNTDQLAVLRIGLSNIIPTVPTLKLRDEVDLVLEADGDVQLVVPSQFGNLVNRALSSVIVTSSPDDAVQIAAREMIDSFPPGFTQLHVI